MKWAVILALALEATAFNLVKTTSRTPKWRSTAKRISLLYGPLNLAGKDQRKPSGAGISMDPKGQGGMTTVSQGLPKQSTILAAHWALRYLDGREATPKNDVYIHHFVSFDTSKRANNPFGGCSKSIGRLAGATFADRGEDSGDTETMFTSSDGKFNSGFHFGASPRLSVQYDLVNYSNTAKAIYIELTVEYEPGIKGMEAGATLKSVQGCGGGSRIALTGGTSSGVIPVERDATIVWARGHLHSGGVKMTMKINNKLVCTSVPTYDAKGVITQMSLCPTPIQVKKGDKVTIASMYDTKQHALRQSTDGSGSGSHTKLGGSDVMGMMAMTYATK